MRVPPVWCDLSVVLGGFPLWALAMASSLGPDAIALELQKVGVHVLLAWVQDCTVHLTNTNPNFWSMPLHKRVDLCYLQFLEADLNKAGAGCLPALGTGGGDGSVGDGAPIDLNGDGSSSGQNPSPKTLPGRFVVQCDETINIGASFNDRYVEHVANPKRVLKMQLTDGKNTFVAYETTPIECLRVLQPAGSKLAITNATAVDGKLMVGPENVTVLGGVVPHLEDARVRVVAKWAAPNRPGNGRGNGRGNSGGNAAGGRETEVRAAAWGNAERASEDAATRDALNHPNGQAPANGQAPPNGQAPSNGQAQHVPQNPTRVEVPPSRVEVPPSRVDPPVVPPVPESPMIDLTDEPVADPDINQVVAADVNTNGRVKRKRAVVIDDSDDDPTPVRGKKQTQTPSQTQTRFGRGTRDDDAVAKPELSVPTVPKPPHVSPPGTPKPPPAWASKLVRSEPFAYCAAVNAMRVCGGRGGVRGDDPQNRKPSFANATLHGWFLDVRSSNASPPVSGGFELFVSIHDGTGVIHAVVPSAMTMKLISGAVASADAFDALAIGERLKLAAWTEKYVRGFLGKITVKVRTANDGSPATVLNMFGPKDFHDTDTTKQLGKRCESMSDAVAKRKAERAAETEKNKQTRGLVEPKKTRTSTGARLARGA